MRKWTIVVLLVVVLAGLAAPAALAKRKHVPPHGYRRKLRVHRTAYVPAPFVYSGVTYIPLRDATSLIGAALLWDSLHGRAMVTYNGREIGLVVGSPSVVYGGETVVLGAAPVVVNNVVFVPAEFCDHYLKLPMEHSRGIVRIRGRQGWREFKVASRPPGLVIARKGPERPGQVRAIVRPRPAMQKGLTANGRARISVAPGKEHKYRAVSGGREKAKVGGRGGSKAQGEGGRQKARGEAGKGRGGGKQKDQGRGRNQ
jgi:hypothetical protein